MTSAAVLARYARALADVALERNEEQQVSADVEMFGRVFAAVPELKDALGSPVVPRDAKERVLAGLLERYPVGAATANFLRVLLANNRLGQFGEIAEEYVRAANERRGVVSATVTAASPISTEQIARLREGLSVAIGKSVEIDLKVDPALLGGLVVQVGSTVYDGSVRSQLTEIRQRLRQAR